MNQAIGHTGLQDVGHVIDIRAESCMCDTSFKPMARAWRAVQVLAKTDARDVEADELRDLQAEAELPMDQLLASYRMAAAAADGDEGMETACMVCASPDALPCLVVVWQEHTNSMCA